MSHKIAAKLLARVKRLHCANRFTLRQICPADATRFVGALGRLVEFNYVERVVSGTGRWHYRLTGRSAARGDKLVLGNGILRVRRNRDYDFFVPCPGDELTPRQAVKRWQRHLG